MFLLMISKYNLLLVAKPLKNNTSINDLQIIWTINISLVDIFELEDSSTEGWVMNWLGRWMIESSLNQNKVKIAPLKTQRKFVNIYVNCFFKSLVSKNLCNEFDWNYLIKRQARLLKPYQSGSKIFYNHGKE